MTETTPAPIGQGTKQFGRGLETLAVVAFALVVGAAPLLHGALDPDTRFALRTGVIGVFALMSLANGLQGKHCAPPTIPTLLLGVYLLLTAISAWRSPYEFGSLQASLDTMIAAAGFFLAAGLVDRPWKRWTVLGSFLFGAAGVAALGILQYTGADLLGPNVLGPAPSGRVASLYANPNHFVGLLDLAAPLSLGLALFSRSFLLRAMFLPLSTVFYINVGLSYSYGGWLAAGVGALFLLIAWTVIGVVRRRTAWPAIGALTLSILALGAAYVFVDNSPRLEGTGIERVRSLLDIQEVTTLRSRRAIQTASLTMTLDHPLFGVGPGNFQNRIVGYRPATIESGADRLLHRSVRHALNDYLNVSTSVGIPGLVAFALFWLWAVLRAPRQHGAVGFAILASLLAVLVHGFVDGNLTYVTGNAFLAFSLAGVLHARVEKLPYSTARHPTNSPFAGTSTTV